MIQRRRAFGDGLWNERRALYDVLCRCCDAGELEKDQPTTTYHPSPVLSSFFCPPIHPANPPAQDGWLLLYFAGGVWPPALPCLVFGDRVRLELDAIASPLSGPFLQHDMLVGFGSEVTRHTLLQILLSVCFGLDGGQHCACACFVDFLF